ncbi:MAG: iron-containing alcohol dehydrogenase, partial [Opitutaceae bacterium]|nr:iron-containing alcohol dehydrogenase [Opitutaceae bacterium]
MPPPRLAARFAATRYQPIMENFTYHNPTRIHFGRGQIARIDRELPTGARVLLLAGGGSIKKNGVYDQVKTALGARATTEYFGVEANPDFDTLVRAIDHVRREQLTHILAVGGGSVLDGAKLVAAAIPYLDATPASPAADAWEILRTHGSVVKSALPVGAVLTLPATGSEANGNAVISRRATREKLAFFSPHVYPVFSILDPETTFSLPPRQVANGIGDAFCHVLEQYLTFPADAAIQDQFAESILRVLVAEAPKTLARPTDYPSRANLMWAATWALNDAIGAGVPQDWATHAIGHELTALHGIDHARTLAIVLPALLDVQRAAKREKLLQYGERVWGITTATTGSEEARIDAAIAATRRFYESLGIATRLSGYDVKDAAAAQTAAEVARRLAARGATPLGERDDITAEKVEQILRLAAGLAGGR